MTIYQYRATLTTSAGATSQQTLNILGGLCRQVFVVANTSATTFLVNIQDESSLRVLDYPAHTGTLNDVGMAVPMCGKYTFQITNASQTDTFKVLIAVEE